MTDDTLLLRQVHPTWIENGLPTSQAFRPTPKDQCKLSVYDGDHITAARAWVHYTSTLGHQSDGVVAVTVRECVEQSLLAYPDPTPFPEHALIDFSSFSGKQIYSRGKKLAVHAQSRGWLYTPAGNP